MDKVEVNGLSFHAKHGCHPEERKTGGQFEVDIVVHCSFTDAAHSDNIDDAIDYVELMDIARLSMEHPRNLIETVAREIAEKILERFQQAEEVRVTLKKLKPPVVYALDFVAVSSTVKRTPN